MLFERKQCLSLVKEALVNAKLRMIAITEYSCSGKKEVSFLCRRYQDRGIFREATTREKISRGSICPLGNCSRGTVLVQVVWSPSEAGGSGFIINTVSFFPLFIQHKLIETLNV